MLALSPPSQPRGSARIGIPRGYHVYRPPVCTRIWPCDIGSVLRIVSIAASSEVHEIGGASDTACRILSSGTWPFASAKIASAMFCVVSSICLVSSFDLPARTDLQVSVRPNTCCRSLLTSFNPIFTSPASRKNADTNHRFFPYGKRTCGYLNPCTVLYARKEVCPRNRNLHRAAIFAGQGNAVLVRIIRVLRKAHKNPTERSLIRRRLSCLPSIRLQLLAHIAPKSFTCGVLGGTRECGDRFVLQKSPQCQSGHADQANYFRHQRQCDHVVPHSERILPPAIVASGYHRLSRSHCALHRWAANPSWWMDDVYFLAAYTAREFYADGTAALPMGLPLRRAHVLGHHARILSPDTQWGVCNPEVNVGSHATGLSRGWRRGVRRATGILQPADR